MKNFSRYIVVTGGSRGIGLEISKSLISLGFSVIIIGKRSEDELNLDNIIFKKDFNYKYFNFDLSLVDNSKEIFKKINKEKLEVIGLVNNAAIGPLVREDIIELKLENFKKIMDVNFFSPFSLTQEFSKYLKNKNQEIKRYIINISSISAYTVSLDRADYCISKAAFSMSSKLWASRMAELGVQVFDIKPGIIKKNYTKEEALSKFNDEKPKNMSLLKRWGLKSDVATVVSTIFENKLPYMTGSSIVIDGGMHIRQL